MLRNKKGVELSLNMIIMTIVGLLVLMILAFMIYKAVTNSNIATSCENNGGQCYAEGQPCPNENPVISAFQSCGKDKKCCTNIGGSSDVPQNDD